MREWLMFVLLLEQLWIHLQCSSASQLHYSYKHEQLKAFHYTWLIPAWQFATVVKKNSLVNSHFFNFRYANSRLQCVSTQ